MAGKRRRRKQRGKRKEAERRLQIKRLQMWEELTDTPEKRIARMRKRFRYLAKSMAVDVQPMQGPTGKIFTIKVRYQDGRDED